MKHKISALLCAAALLCVGAASACGSADRNRADSNYPYDVAVSQGYGGTEGEWLSQNASSSTVYRRMWEEATADGSFNGTYYEFLQSLGVTKDESYLQTSLLSSVRVIAQMTSTTGSAGAGVILSADETTGDLTVATNYHVVYNTATGGIASEIKLYLYGASSENDAISASFAGGSMREDLALLTVEGDERVKETDGGSHTNAEIVKASAARAAEIGDSNALTVGESVYAVGNPENWGVSVTRGVVSMDAEYVAMDALDGSEDVSMLVIRTDAAVNHGNSGGGLFNEAGELVGIVNARSEKSGVAGVGYAIPVNHAIAVLNNLSANGGKLLSAKLGIGVTTESSRAVYDETACRTFISEKIAVVSVSSGGAAIRAGMDIGDTLVSATLNGKTTYITRRHYLTDLLLNVRMGDTVEIVVSRNGNAVTLTVRYDRSEYFEEG